MGSRGEFTPNIQYSSSIFITLQQTVTRHSPQSDFAKIQRIMETAKKREGNICKTEESNAYIFIILFLISYFLCIFATTLNATRL